MQTFLTFAKLTHLGGSGDGVQTATGVGIHTRQLQGYGKSRIWECNALAVHRSTHLRMVFKHIFKLFLKYIYSTFFLDSSQLCNKAGASLFKEAVYGAVIPLMVLP